MTLSNEAISDFKKIFYKQFPCEQLTDAEAEQKALAMLKLFRLVYSESASKDWQKELQEKYAKSK